MFPLIETAAAFAAVMLVASLFVSALVQAIQSGLRLRAAGLSDMLLTLIHNYTEIHGIALDEEGEKAFVEAILTHPLLHSRRIGKAARAGTPRPIEYLDQDDLVDLVKTEMTRATKSARAVKKAVRDVEQFTRFVERWYETVGATASQHFKNRMRQLTLLVSCAVVVAFNFDGLHLIDALHDDSAQRSALAREIAAIQDTSRKLSPPRGTGEEPAFIASSDPTLQSLTRELNTTSKLLEETGVGVGWQSSFIAQRWRAHQRQDSASESPFLDARTLGEAMLWLAGLVFSCVMLSLGAPFWATTLGGLVNLTNAVQKAKMGEDSDAPKNKKRPPGKDEPIKPRTTPEES
jgi:hypothetical protein